MTTRRFAVVAPSLDEALVCYTSLFKMIKKRKYRVLIVAPEARDQKQAVRDVARLNKIGAEFRPIRLPASGFALRNHVHLNSSLKSIFANWPPDCVLAMGCPMIAAAVPAARARRATKVVSLCDNLPDFMKPTSADQSQVFRFLLARALSKSDTVVFQNAEHKKMLCDAKLVRDYEKCVVVPGCGVDVERQAALPLPDVSDGIVFAMAARLEAERGVVNFCQAAEQVARQAPTAKFIILGYPSADTLDVAAAGFSGAQFEVLSGDVKLRKALERAHVFVYPSHSEGMPYTVLEALAAGRPILTTNTPGCRDTVDETVNGFLVPRGNITALVEAMNGVLKRPDLIAPMARASRLKAERRFDVRDVNRSLLDILDPEVVGHG